ncbi:hypothetical protein CBM2637_A110045 [Cupriavidus taiwanensis]|nr:hypothetical protein CBM2637_A110045 [Cupriavidus taiwanensis]
MCGFCLQQEPHDNLARAQHPAGTMLSIVCQSPGGLHGNRLPPRRTRHRGQRWHPPNPHYRHGHSGPGDRR